jgi:acyl-CoA dehydrogenase
MTAPLGVQRADPSALVDGVVPVLRTHAATADATGEFPLASLNALRQSGLMGLLVPTAYGGMGAGLREMAEVGERLAAGCLPTAFAWVMHCQQVDAIAQFAEESLRRRLLPRVAGPGDYIASVTTENGTGGKLLRADDALIPAGDGYRFRRFAPVVTGGLHADGFLVKLRTSPDRAETDVTLVYADREQLRIEATGPRWTSLGMRGVENVSLEIQATVPADQLVGGYNGFRQVVIQGFSAAAHIGWSACWLGAARGVFSELLRELRARRVRVDVSSDLVRQRLALIRCRLEAVSAYLRCVVDEVTARRQAGQTLELPAVQIHINTLKILAGRETFDAVDEMIDLVGMRAGYLADGPIPLERVFRDLRAARLTYDDYLLLISNGSLSLLDPSVSTAGR